MLQDPDLLKIHSPIQAHPVIQYTHLIHQHQLRLESNIIFALGVPIFALQITIMCLSLQVCNYLSPADRGWRDYSTLSEISYSQSPYTSRWDPGTLCVWESKYNYCKFR